MEDSSTRCESDKNAYFLRNAIWQSLLLSHLVNILIDSNVTYSLRQS